MKANLSMTYPFKKKFIGFDLKENVNSLYIFYSECPARLSKCHKFGALVNGNVFESVKKKKEKGP